MHQYKGKLIIHTGSMFSGKTSSLEKDMKRFKIAGYKTLAFKPSMDTRYSKDLISTHDDRKLECYLVEEIDNLDSLVKKEDPDVIGIDEAQFIKGDIQTIIEKINSYLSKDKTVIIAGLDMDYQGRSFEVIKELMPIADYLHKHHAVCASCGSDAWISNRTSHDQERILIGASDEYEPLCRKCYLEKQEK